MDQSNAFTWDTHHVPQPEGKKVTADGNENETFRIRHMKAGRTGARKTWAAAPVLLNYLTLRDGLQSLQDKNIKEADTVLDMARLNCEKSSCCDSTKQLPSYTNSSNLCNILELGGGSGFVSVGLAKALRSSSSEPSPCVNTKIMCTDMDRDTIKNMRHNICENKETKTIAIEKLEWGDDVGGEKFAKALQRKFVAKTNVPPNSGDNISDPVQLLTHVIASDVHYGETTLDPLSSIISSIKLRNPNVQVIIMLKERSPNSVAELVEQIQMKVNNDEQNALQNDVDFMVHVRDVIQTGVPELQMKLVEC